LSFARSDFTSVMSLFATVPARMTLQVAGGGEDGREGSKPGFFSDMMVVDRRTVSSINVVLDQTFVVVELVMKFLGTIGFFARRVSA